MGVHSWERGKTSIMTQEGKRCVITCNRWIKLSEEKWRPKRSISIIIAINDRYKEVSLRWLRNIFFWVTNKMYYQGERREYSEYLVERMRLYSSNWGF